jgi:hypothetical protein
MIDASHLKLEYVAFGIGVVRKFQSAILVRTRFVNSLASVASGPWVTLGHNSTHQAAEFFDRSLLAFGHELLVDVERRART